MYHVFPATFHVISRKVGYLWDSVPCICGWGGGSHSYRVHAPPPPPGGGGGEDLGWIVDLAGISRGEDNVQALAWGSMHCQKGGRPGFALARPQALTGPPAALLGYTVPKVIDFPRYYRKWSRENKILSGIFRVVHISFSYTFCVISRKIVLFFDSVRLKCMYF